MIRGRETDRVMGFDTSSPTGWDLLSGVFLALAAQAAHWFITAPPGAGSVRTGLVALQLAVCAGLAWWVYRRGRELEGETRASDREGAAA